MSTPGQAARERNEIYRAEIERLRAQVAEGWPRLTNEIAQLQAEIERLRAHGTSILKKYGKAQEEIEHLRAEIERLTECNGTLETGIRLEWKNRDELRAEVERLRAELAALAE
jgi:chromosome segregation ATPase